MTATITPDQHDLLEKIATPTRLGKAISRDMWAERYLVDPWQLAFEKTVLPPVTNNPLLSMTDDEWDRYEEALEADDEDALEEWDFDRQFFRLHLPPQVGKTRYMTLLIFWILGMMPDTRIIFITYSDDYSRERGLEIRKMIEAFGWMFGIELDPTKTSSTDFGIKGHRGGVLAVGIGSQITGRSGDVIIIDDLLKNMKEATSTATKRLHESEFFGTIYTRLQPGGTMILTNTRFAEDDLAGRLEEREESEGYEGDRFQVMAFPAIAEIPERERVDLTEEEQEAWRDIIGRRVGEPLKCRYYRGGDWKKSSFYKVRSSMVNRPMEWKAVFQQDPSSLEGGMFPPKKWARYRLSDLTSNGGTIFMDQLIRVWDLAASEGSGDWTVGGKFGRDSDGNVYVLDIVRKRLSPDNVLERVKATSMTDGYGTRIRFEEERSGSGKHTVAFYKSALPGYNVDGRRAEGDKETRLMPASTKQQEGTLLIPDDADEVTWVRGYIAELARMMGDGRRPAHDDQADVTGYAVLELLDSGPVEVLDSSGMDLTTEDEMAGLLMEYVRIG